MPRSRKRPRPPPQDGAFQPGGSAAFEALGYAPLRDYHAAGHRAPFDDYARDAAAAVAAAVEAASADNATVIVCAHAVYLPAAALFVAEALGAADADRILDCDTREAEGYLVTHDGEVALLERDA